MYVRVTKTVTDKGVLVRPEEVDQTVTDRDADWYVSAFTYSDDALDYWNNNDRSIKGYKGEAYTRALYWDLDSKGDFEKVRAAGTKLIKKLKKIGFNEDCIEVFFSGNKGVHIYAHTKDKFTPEETSAICYNIAISAGVPSEILDTSVYNVNRIFRITNTRHQESKLFKIPLDISEFEALPEDKIRWKAQKMRDYDFQPDSIEIKTKLEEYLSKLKVVKDADVIPLNPDQLSKIDFTSCPSDMRKCIWALEQGNYGPGERHNATIRLAAYYKSKGHDYEYATHMIYESLEKRRALFPDVKPFNDAEVERDLQEIYSDKWEGGAFTCKKDEYLRSKCDHGEGPCALKKVTYTTRVVGVEQLIRAYVEFGLTSKGDYPKTGLEWLDEKMRLRPKDYSILNGANGSGKTSLVVAFIEHFNKQKYRHIFFSLDMADTSLFEKLGSRYTQYDQRQIERAFSADENHRNEKIMKEVMDAIREKLPYTLFDFTSSAQIDYIEQAVLDAEEVYGEKIKICMIDYAGRIPGEHPNQYANATANANSINDVCKRLNAHFMVLSQVARENGDHTDPLRTSRVSKDSGAWEENASIIINCWRPFGNGLEGQDAYMNIYIAKNRTGTLGEHVFGWEGKRGDVFELTDKQFALYVKQFERYFDGEAGKIYDARISKHNDQDEFQPRNNQGTKFILEDEGQDEEEELPRSSKFRRSE